MSTHRRSESWGSMYLLQGRSWSAALPHLQRGAGDCHEDANLGGGCRALGEQPGCRCTSRAGRWDDAERANDEAIRLNPARPREQACVEHAARRPDCHRTRRARRSGDDCLAEVLAGAVTVVALRSSGRPTTVWRDWALFERADGSDAALPTSRRRSRRFKKPRARTLGWKADYKPVVLVSADSLLPGVQRRRAGCAQGAVERALEIADSSRGSGPRGETRRHQPRPPRSAVDGDEAGRERVWSRPPLVLADAPARSFVWVIDGNGVRLPWSFPR